MNTFYAACYHISSQSRLSTPAEVWAGGQLITHIYTHTHMLHIKLFT